MYIKTFGKNGQVFFNTEEDYYEFLGYLAKNDGTTKIVWETNDEQGAWAQEGRIHFYVASPVALRATLNHTLGTGNIKSRVNCNDFVKHIEGIHHFLRNGLQKKEKIRTSIPQAHLKDFDRGLAL